jgi:hypothetical protein
MGIDGATIDDGTSSSRTRTAKILACDGAVDVRPGWPGLSHPRSRAPELDAFSRPRSSFPLPDRIVAKDSFAQAVLDVVSM